ncbi:MAG: hypothetical protein QQN41_06015 [Nitrosopumilus sp.]
MLKFDDNGKVIPKISKEEAHYKCQQNLAEYNNDVRAHNLTVKVVEAIATVIVILPNAQNLAKIEALLSPELSARVKRQVLVIKANRKIGVRYDSRKIANNVEKILLALKEGAVLN